MGLKALGPDLRKMNRASFFCLLRRWLLTMNISFQSEDEDQLVVPGHGMPKAHRDCWWVEGKPSLFYFSVLYDLQNFVKHILTNPGASLLREEDGPGGWGRHPWWRVQGNHQSQSIIWACLLPIVKTPYPCVQRILISFQDCYHFDAFRDMFSVSLEAMTSRASPWSRVSWPTAGWGCSWRRGPPATVPARM